MKYAGLVFELCGMAAVCYGAYQLAPWLAWVLAGLLAMVVGQSMGGRPT